MAGASALALATTVPSGPASAGAPGTLSFSGYTWTVKSGPHRMGPGPNYFASSNAWVDSEGRLHLAITKVGSQWTVGEVYATRSLGYGTYTWVLDTRVDNLDPNMVLGLFTYANARAYHHREIDVEASRWRNIVDHTNAQFVVQPSGRRHNLLRITEQPTLPATFSFRWTATSLTFSAPNASPSAWTYTGKNRPPAGGELADMNFWLTGGRAPAFGTGASVIIRSFTFTPA
ncbi:MAG TPA: hypothetical protein VMF60_08090 [Acidimicrobiales bacterium]|nr:hypothetical protein [Acidimicrobiales bacterium]